MRPTLRKNFLLVLILSSTILLNGCIVIVAGTLGAVGGYVVSPDTVEGITNRTFDEVVGAVEDVVGIMGTIQDKSRVGGYFLAIVQGNKVTINVSQASKTAVKLTVKARRLVFPRITIAQEVYVKIMKKIE